MTSIPSRLLLVAFPALVAGGCATKGDVRSLERQVVRELQDVKQQQDRLAERIGVAFDSLTEQERRQLTGRGELSRTFSQIEDMLGQLLDLVNQNNVLLQRLQERGAGVAGAPPPVGAERVGPEPGGGGATAVFRAAQQQLNRGAYETARSGFQQFLEQHPGHELAPDAQFFLAETYARTDEEDRALEEYRRIEELYPDSRRAPTALYRRGLIQLEQANTSEARRLFERILAGYPNSPEADLAERQLAELRP